MGKMWVALRFLLVAIAVSTYISACGGSGSSTASTAGSTAKTASWTNVSVRALDGRININWDKAAGSTFGTALSTYNIYCSTTPTGIVQAGNRIASNYAGTSFDHSNVTNGQRYYYVVTEVSAAGEGPGSLAVCATPYTAAPAAPFGLKVTSLDSAVKLDFLVPTPVTPSSVSYNLYRSTTRAGLTSASKIASSLVATTYSDPNITNGTIYYYALTTVVSGKESAFSPIAAFQPLAKTAAVDSSATQLASFASPTDMSVEPGNASCTIRWSDVAPLVISNPDPATSATPYYILYWSDTPDVMANIKGQKDDAAKALVKDANGIFSYKLTGLTNGAMYYFLITAAVRGTAGAPIQGRSTPGPVVSATPSPKTPATPAGLSATQGTQQVALSWSKDTSGLSGVTYNIYVSTTDANSPAELMAKGDKKNNSDSSKTYFTHTGLTAGQAYFYVVTAVVAGEGESAPSSIVSVTLFKDSTLAAVNGAVTAGYTLELQGSFATNSIKGIQFEVIIPPGLTLRSDAASGVPLSGIVTTSLSSAAAEASVLSWYNPSDGVLHLGMTTNKGIGVGDLATITCDIVPGWAKPSATAFSVRNIKAVDGTTTTISGVTVTVK